MIKINSQTQPNPVDFIVSKMSHLPENTALVCVINQNVNGYMLGVATQGESGYHPSNIIFEEPNYNIANEWVEKANEKIYNRNYGETMKIVLSSLR